MMFSFSSQVFAVSQDSLLRNLWCEQKVFTVTAYYSPVAGQLFYNKDNYYDEVVLNWKWTHGASWKPVFNGMLAAPKSYTFGTNIYFPERWRWEVADRWWAIVEAGERHWKNDRIDIRVGKWEQWLIRALTRWVRDVKARVCPKWTNIAKQSATKQKKVWLDWTKLPYFKYFFLMSMFLKELEEWQKSVRVRELQNQLIKLWYMKNWRNTSYFGKETKSAVCKFQLDNKVVSKWSERCGHYWPRTRSAIKQKLKQKRLIPTDYWSVSSFNYLHNYAENGGKLQINQERPGKIKKSIDKSKKTKGNQTDNLSVYLPKSDVSNLSKSLEKNTKKSLFSNILLDKELKKSFHKWDKWDDIVILQHKLTSIWYSVSPTWYYGNQTISAIKKFQKAHWVTQSWYLDKQTRRLLNKIRL